MAANEIVQLHDEIERLTRELDQASSEKIQSAQYGLGLLEEKSQLQHRCEELETLYENAKHELDITQEVGTYMLHLGRLQIVRMRRCIWLSLNGFLHCIEH